MLLLQDVVFRKKIAYTKKNLKKYFLYVWEVIDMAFWEDFGETISMKSREMADKAKNFTDIASLRGQIVSYENTIARYYREIGRAYYHAHKDEEEPESAESMKAIKEAEQMIAELERRISELKGTKKCPSCNSEVPDESVFCLKCGAKMNEDVFFDDEAEVLTDVVVTEIVEEE